MSEKVELGEDDLMSPQLYYNPGMYAITLSPDDKHQYNCDPGRMHKFRVHVNEEMLSLPGDGIDYVLHTELSEPCKSYDKGMDKWPRLHCHGIINFRNYDSVKNFLLNHFYRLSKVNNIYIKPIKDMDKWHAYCTKQHLIMKTPRISNVENYMELFYGVQAKPKEIKKL